MSQSNAHFQTKKRLILAYLSPTRLLLKTQHTLFFNPVVRQVKGIVEKRTVGYLNGYSVSLKPPA